MEDNERCENEQEGIFGWLEMAKGRTDRQPPPGRALARGGLAALVRQEKQCKRACCDGKKNAFLNLIEGDKA
jgi:hypothetical protein